MQLPRPGLVLTFMILASTVCHGIIILDEDVESPPHVHKSGSLDTLTLDCPFAVEEDDVPVALTVQWYIGGYRPNIYYWVHNNNPQSVGPFVNRVDLSYKVSEDPIYKHRALSILHPTSELSGVYTCSVQTFMDKKELTRRVIIYSEPTEFALETNQIDDSNVKVICEAEGIFPEPEVYIYINYDGEILQLEDVKEEKTWKSSNGNEGEGSYSIHTEFTIADEDLSGLTEFGCDLRIPETNITFTDTISYEPRGRMATSEIIDEPETSPRNDLAGVSPHDAASTSASNRRYHLSVLLFFVAALFAILSI